MIDDPHRDRPVAQGGAPLSRARLAVVAAHGRGGSAADMLALGEHIAIPDVAWLAPQAADHSWWPGSFLAPLAENEPGLTSALEAMGAAVELAIKEGFDPDRIVVMGFSQGACLALEHAARTGRHYRAVAGLSGGLVGTGEANGGPSDELYGYSPKSFHYTFSTPGMPTLLACHERDPHIPMARVRESAAIFEAAGAKVDLQIIPGAGHGIVVEEIAWLRAALNG